MCQIKFRRSPRLSCLVYPPGPLPGVLPGSCCCPSPRVVKASCSPVMSQVTLSRSIAIFNASSFDLWTSLGLLSWSRIFKMLRSYARGLFYCLVLYLCAFFGCIFLMGPTMPLLWLRPQWFRWVNDRLISSWLLLPPVRKTFKNTSPGVFLLQTIL